MCQSKEKNFEQLAAVGDTIKKQATSLGFTDIMDYAELIRLWGSKRDTHDRPNEDEDLALREIAKAFETIETCHFALRAALRIFYGTNLP